MQKARKIAGSSSLPIVGVHHMEAHALVARYEQQLNNAIWIWVGLYLLICERFSERKADWWCLLTEDECLVWFVLSGRKLF